MSDLPQWAKTGEEGGSTDLADKLVDESGKSKPEPDADPEAAAEEPEANDQEESGLASRTLCFLRFLAILTILLALVVIATNCYIIYKRYDEIKARGILIRVYGILFCVFVVFAELEWALFLKYFGFLKYWPARGLFYVFVGLITWDQTDGTSASTYGTYEDVVAFMMMGLGGVYFLLGLACMRTVKEAERARLAEEAANS